MGNKGEYSLHNIDSVIEGACIIFVKEYPLFSRIDIISKLLANLAKSIAVSTTPRLSLVDNKDSSLQCNIKQRSKFF